MERIVKKLNEAIGESFTKKEWLLYGLVYPLALVAVCLLSEIINSLQL